MEYDVLLGRMNGARRRGRPRQIWLDTLKGYSSGATISKSDETPGIERDGEELPRLSPGVGCDSTAQGNYRVPCQFNVGWIGCYQHR